VPLLSDALVNVRTALEKAMPVPKKRNALEEAEWEEEGGIDGALEREMLQQCVFYSTVLGFRI
jgi:ATPase family AAA domain-containing protein 2